MRDDSITILCVDDEETQRILRKLVLETQGYKVLVAASGAEALALLDQGGIDLVLSDQMMPGMSGSELTKFIKHDKADMPVIIISGMNEIPPEAHRADRFVSKLEGPEVLFDSITQVLREYGHAGEPEALKVL